MPEPLAHSPAPATAGVIAPPPLLFLIALVLGLALSWLYPLGVVTQAPLGLRAPLGLALIAAALWLSFAAAGRFARAGTPRAPWLPSTALVADGVFARVRNPMYQGMVLFVLGLGLALGADLMIAAALVLALILHVGVVRREERYLEARFADAYRAYRAATPRYGWKL